MLDIIMHVGSAIQQH